LQVSVTADSSLKSLVENANAEVVQQSRLCSLHLVQSSELISSEGEFKSIEEPCQDAAFRPLSTWPCTAATGLTNQVHSQGDHDTVRLSILNMTGAEVGVLQCLPGDAVADVKRRLSRTTGTPGHEQRLVYGNLVLKDRETLKASGITQAHATLQCIKVRPSGVARNLEARRQSQDPNEAISASLAEVADSLMQTEHVLSESVRPRATDVIMSITPQHRGELINWMLLAFDVIHFDDSMLHSVVLTLDRYCARRASPIEVTAMQKLLMAAVCTEMKLASESDYPRGHRERLLAHLCHGRLSTAAILKAECDMFCGLGFVVGTPTPVTFLREFAMLLDEAGTDNNQALQLALFLLELALFEPEVQYHQPHVILAAGALSAALRALDAPSAQRETLVGDLPIYCPDLHSIEDAVLDCEESLLKHWVMCSRGSITWGQFYAHLENKFSCEARHNVSRLSPTASLERFLQDRLPGASK
jgi:hypothetical protein